MGEPLKKQMNTQKSSPNQTSWQLHDTNKCKSNNAPGSNTNRHLGKTVPHFTVALLNNTGNQARSSKVEKHKIIAPALPSEVVAEYRERTH